MKITEIAKMPTSINRIHQSVYRAAATLQLVRDWIGKGVSTDVLAEVIDQLAQERAVCCRIENGKIVEDIGATYADPVKGNAQ